MKTITSRLLNTMTIKEAFKDGLRQAREALGLPPDQNIRGTDIPLLAAYTLFNARALGKEHDERFPEQGPAYAKALIIRCYAKGEDKS